MLYYNPHSFYGVIFALHGSVLPLCVPQALVFAGIGALAAWLVDRGYLQHDVNEVSLLCGLVISLLFTFRLNFSFARYEEAVNAISALQGGCRRLISRLCAYLPPDEVSSEEVIESVHRIRRWVILVFLLCNARVRSDDTHAINFATLEAMGLVTPEERRLLKLHVTSSSSPAAAAAAAAAAAVTGAEAPMVADEQLGTFPSKARVHFVCHLLWGELSLHLRQGRVHPQQFAMLDKEVGELAHEYNRLERLLSQLLPFSFANMAKGVLLLYMISFPFSIAKELGWATPAVAFAQALLFLAMDTVGAVMDTPFAHSEWFGVDLEKRVRRTDKETAALVGVWLGRPCMHFNLYPETMRSTLPRRYHEDNVRGSGGLSRRKKEGRPGSGGAAAAARKHSEPEPAWLLAHDHSAMVGPGGASLLRQPTNGVALRGRAGTQAPRGEDGAPGTDGLVAPLLARTDGR